MGLRTKIAAIFVPLLLLAVLAVSATEANHAVGVMVEDLGDSGNVLVNETFEQIRTALALSQGDPVVALRQDKSLAALLSSSSAFGKGVVYARVVTLNGDLVAGAGGDSGNLLIRGRDELSALARKFNELSQRVRSDRVQWEDERGRFINIFRSIDDAVLLLDAGGLIRFSNDDAQGRLGLPAGGLAQGKALAALIGESHPLVRVMRTAKAAGTELRDVAIEEGPGKDKSPPLASIL